MTEQEMRQKITNAIDVSLAGMQGDPWLAQRVKNRAEGSEKIVKKKISAAVVLMIVLAIAGATALAATLYPKTLERFTESYGQEFGAHLGRGDTAQMGNSYILGDVKYTVTDVIWADGVLYGTVVMEPADGANVVLLTMEEMDFDGVNTLLADGKTTLLRYAQERGAKLLYVDCIPNGYVLDGRTLSGDVGISCNRMEDGNAVVSFEICGWNGGIARAQEYTLNLLLRSWEVTEENKVLETGKERYEWIVKAVPEMKAAAKESVALVSTSGVPVLVPEGYTGQMNVYALAPRNAAELVQPEWFNQSGPAQKTLGRDSVSYEFPDEDELQINAPCYLYYYAYEGTETVVQKDGVTGKTTEWTRKRAETPNYIANLVSWLRFEGENDNPVEKLTGISLEEAQRLAEDMLAKLGVTDAECVWRYGADLAAIQALSDKRNLEISQGKWLSNNSWNAPFTTADEGYYLCYTARVDGAAADGKYLTASFFINQDGVRDAHITAPFLRGEATRCEQLISADEALSNAVHAGKKSWIPELGGYLEKANRIELIYTVQNQTSLIPAWRITANDGEKEDCEFEVIVSAVTGEIKDAPWQ